jgi:hypothetical protein
LHAGEGLPQGIDRAGEASNLLGQPSGVGLLGRQQAPYRLQLILNHLQLVDRFLLGSLKALGLLDQLL